MKHHISFLVKENQTAPGQINKQKIQNLNKAGLMTEAGYTCIENAKKNGSWIILDEVEELVLPHDLETALAKKPEAKSYYENLSKSTRKGILQWVVLAKRSETRFKRITEIVVLADQRQVPKIF